MTNAKAILDFVNEVAERTPDRRMALSLDWFRWVMEEAHKAEECAHVMNPEWFRANGRMLSFHGDREPSLMLWDLGPKQEVGVFYQRETNEKTQTDQEQNPR